MAKKKFARIVVKKVRDEVRVSGQLQTRRGQYFNKQTITKSLDKKKPGDLKSQVRLAFDELMKETE